MTAGDERPRPDLSSWPSHMILRLTQGGSSARTMVPKGPAKARRWPAMGREGSAGASAWLDLAARSSRGGSINDGAVVAPGRLRTRISLPGFRGQRPRGERQFGGRQAAPTEIAVSSGHPSRQARFHVKQPACGMSRSSARVCGWSAAEGLPHGFVHRAIPATTWRFT